MGVKSPSGWLITDTWVTKEKGDRMMNYVIMPAMRVLLTEWFNENRAGVHFLFPSTSGAGHISVSYINQLFKSIAVRAGVQGAHVHPHTTRHTVAWTLNALGNSIEDISKTLGHKDPKVTAEVYVAMTQQERMGRMTCPWAGTQGHPPAEVMKERGLELASALASPFLSADGKTFPVFRAEDVFQKQEDVRSERWISTSHQQEPVAATEEASTAPTVDGSLQRSKLKKRKSDEMAELHKKLKHISIGLMNTRELVPL